MPFNFFNMFRDFNPADEDGLFKDFYMCIGLIAVHWARVEKNLEKLIIGFSQMNPGFGWVLTSNMGYRTKIHTLLFHQEIFAEMDAANAIPEASDIGNRLKDLIVRCDKAYADRNYYVHSYWAVGNSKETVTNVIHRFKGKSRIESNDHTVDEAMKVACDIIQLVSDIQDFMKDIGYQKVFQDWANRHDEDDQPEPDA